MSSDLIPTLYDHYKDTCSIVRKAVQRRDRFMFFVIVALSFFAFQGLFPTASDGLVNDFLNFKFGFKLNTDLSVLGNAIWFLLLLLTLRYFQLAVFVERQYPYLHGLEEKLNKHLNTEVIGREGNGYLSNYPMFSDWMHVLYTLIFPLLLLAVTGAKISGELADLCVYGWSFSLILDTVAFVLLAISTTLYMLFIRGKK